MKNIFSSFLIFFLRKTNFGSLVIYKKNLLECGISSSSCNVGNLNMFCIFNECCEVGIHHCCI